MLLLEDYDVRGVAQAYIAGLKVKSIISPKLGNLDGRETAEPKAGTGRRPHLRKHGEVPGGSASRK
jgi:hypothetical protein